MLSTGTLLYTNNLKYFNYINIISIVFVNENTFPKRLGNKYHLFCYLYFV